MLSEINEKISDIDPEFNCLYFPVPEIINPKAEDY